MSEYIGYFFIGMISCVLYLTLLVTVLVWRERKVHCRNCKYYTEDEAEYLHYCNEWCGQVDPDGFCAWGERRDA